jgi:hypothetical protein
MRDRRDCETPQVECRPDRTIEGLPTIAILLLAALAKANEFEEAKDPDA